MPVYNPPVRDLTFVANELVNFEQYRELLKYEDADPDTIVAVLEESGRLAAEVIQPINQPGDEQGCKLDDGVVTVPDGFKEAYDLYVESGWAGLGFSQEFGGQGMPNVLNFMVDEMFDSANRSFAMYPMLTHGSIHALETWASEEVKQMFLPNLVSGKWTGTMNLTESHAGTDLGMIRTKAEPTADGKYKISGEKIFISAGEHEMSENIIHLTLARLPGAPEGTKGITLFVIPKYKLNDDGTVGERNSLKCTSIEHKMGIRASATCVLNFEEAEGIMVGEPNKGMRAMFTMMNSARLGVAVEGMAVGEVAYQNAAAYAKERIQGRSLTGKKQPEKAADPIIVHADVRRMLLTQRSFVEGARALTGEIALNLDIVHRHSDPEVVQAADDFVQLMTPVAKAFFTDEGFASANHAIQVYGGHGFICEHGVEQFARDSRISMLYEGTNGVQAMDLVGRKLGLNGGRAITAFLENMKALLAEQDGVEGMEAYVEPMKAANKSLLKAIGWLMENAAKNPDNLGSSAVEFLRLLAVNAVGAQWVRMARISLDTLAAGTDEKDFYETKLTVGRFFMERYVSEHYSLVAKIENGCDTMMAMSADMF